MEFLSNGYTLEIPAGCFPLSTDSILLAQFVHLPKNARVLDLGSGCGTVGTLLCAQNEFCHVTGVELDPAAHEAALENIQRNGLEHRLSSICADLRTVPADHYDLCVSNPPYYSGGPASRATPTARREDHCTPDALMEAASRSLKFGGHFYLVHKPEKLAQLIACGAEHGLEAKRLRLIRHKEGGGVSLILLDLCKGAKPGLIWEEFALHHPDGTPTDYYRTLYHLN